MESNVKDRLYDLIVEDKKLETAIQSEQTERYEEVYKIPHAAWHSDFLRGRLGYGFIWARRFTIPALEQRLASLTRLPFTVTVTINDTKQTATVRFVRTR